MKRYFVNGKEISEQKAKEIEANNKKYMESNDLSLWAKGEKAGTQTLVTAKGRDHFLKLINNVKL